MNDAPSTLFLSCLVVITLFLRYYNKDKRRKEESTERGADGGESVLYPGRPLLGQPFLVFYPLFISYPKNPLLGKSKPPPLF